MCDGDGTLYVPATIWCAMASNKPLPLGLAVVSIIRYPGKHVQHRYKSLLNLFGPPSLLANDKYLPASRRLSKKYVRRDGPSRRLVRTGLYTRHTQGRHFMTFSDLAKYSMTGSIARFLYDSWAPYLCCTISAFLIRFTYSIIYLHDSSSFSSSDSF